MGSPRLTKKELLTLVDELEAKLLVAEARADDNDAVNQKRAGALEKHIRDLRCSLAHAWRTADFLRREILWRAEFTGADGSRHYLGGDLRNREWVASLDLVPDENEGEKGVG